MATGDIKQTDAATRTYFTCYSPVGRKRLLCAIAIIAGIGALAAAVVGGFGLAGSFSNLNQIRAIIMIAAGGAGCITLLLLGIICLKRLHSQIDRSKNDSDSLDSEGWVIIEPEKSVGVRDNSNPPNNGTQTIPADEKDIPEDERFFNESDEDDLEESPQGDIAPLAERKPIIQLPPRKDQNKLESQDEITVEVPPPVILNEKPIEPPPILTKEESIEDQIVTDPESEDSSSQKISEDQVSINEDDEEAPVEIAQEEPTVPQSPPKIDPQIQVIPPRRAKKKFVIEPPTNNEQNALFQDFPYLEQVKKELPQPVIHFGLLRSLRNSSEPIESQTLSLAQNIIAGYCPALSNQQSPENQITHPAQIERVLSYCNERVTAFNVLLKQNQCKEIDLKQFDAKFDELREVAMVWQVLWELAQKGDLTQEDSELVIECSKNLPEATSAFYTDYQPVALKIEGLIGELNRKSLDKALNMMNEVVLDTTPVKRKVDLLKMVAETLPEKEDAIWSKYPLVKEGLERALTQFNEWLTLRVFCQNAKNILDPKNNIIVECEKGTKNEMIKCLKTMIAKMDLKEVSVDDKDAIEEDQSLAKEGNEENIVRSARIIYNIYLSNLDLSEQFAIQQAAENICNVLCKGMQHMDIIVFTNKIGQCKDPESQFNEKIMGGNVGTQIYREVAKILDSQKNKK